MMPGISKNDKIYVAGHRGMVGSALVRNLRSKGYTNIICRSRSELDLLDQNAVHAFLQLEQPAYIFLAAAKVGGIHANNTFRADFIYENLVVEANIIHGAHLAGVERLCFLGSSCIYPRDCAQPIREEYLLTGPLEPTNEPYAIAKIAGIKLCGSYNRQYGVSHGVDYRSVMPTNLYGPGDNYHPQNSHVIPALIRRFHEATQARTPQVTIWGTGTPQREFLYVDDMARACVHVMNLTKATYEQHTSPMQSHINVGCGQEISIAALAKAIAKTIGYKGEIGIDTSQPEGPPRKFMDSSRLNALGWQASIGLETGLALAYADFLSQISRKPRQNMTNELSNS